MSLSKFQTEADPSDALLISLQHQDAAHVIAILLTCFLNGITPAYSLFSLPGWNVVMFSCGSVESQTSAYSHIVAVPRVPQGA